jgi:hypothetical protein
MVKAILSVLVILILTSIASACDCFYYPEHRIAFKEAKAIFIGRVIKIETSAKKPTGLEMVDEALTFKVEKSWKGVTHSQVKAWVAAFDSLCSHWRFQEGQEYLVYASEDKGSLIVNGYCSRTRLLNEVQPDSVKELKELDRFQSFWFRLKKHLPLI